MADKQYTWDQDFVENNPNEDTGLVRYGGRYTNDTRKALEERIDDEHEWNPSEPAPQSRMGFHKQGSAVAFVSDTAPTTLPDGVTFLSDSDKGRLWFDTVNSTMNAWNGVAWENLSTIGVGTKLRWDATIQYAQAEIVEYQGVLHAAIVDPPTVGTPPSYPEWMLFTVPMPNAILWELHKEYSAGNLVYYNEQFWIAVAPVYQSPPGTVGGEWEFLKLTVDNIDYLSLPTPWDETIEYPVDGDKMVVGELIGDGTLSLVSSSGRKPVVGNVEMIPGKTVLDGVEYYDPMLKWPGRAIYGVFEGYENVAAGDLTPGTLCETQQEGSWLKILATADASNSTETAGSKDIGNLNSGIITLFVRKGNTSRSEIGIDAEGTVNIVWGTPPTFTFSGGAIDAGSRVISGNLVFISYRYSGTTHPTIRFYPNLYSSASTGDYTYYKDWQVVDLPFPVPYTKGTHNFNLWQYGMDWALSSEWSVEGWFYNTGDLSHAGYINIFHTAVGAIANRWSIYFSPGSRELKLYSLTEGGGGALSIGNPPVGWNHVKVLWESGTRFRASLNGGSYAQSTTNIITTGDCNKIVTLGSFGDDSGYFNSYMADWHAQAGLDESHDHFNLNKGFYSPRKTYGKDFLWSADDDGNISGELPGNSIKEYQLADDSVSERTIQDGAVTVDKIGSGAVHQDKLSNKSVIESKLADDSVSSRTIQDAAVLSDHITAKAISNSKLADSESLNDRDLNTVTITGFYTQTTTSNSTPENHYPISAPGSLIVNGQSNSDNVSQIYSTWDSNVLYVRYLNAGAWFSWNKQYSEADPPPVPPAEFPIGTVYTQYPGKQSPVDLAFPGTWTNITADFAGNFFRAEGGNSAPFDGSIQTDSNKTHSHTFTGTVLPDHTHGYRYGHTSFGYKGDDSSTAEMRHFDDGTATGGTSAGTPAGTINEVGDVEARPVNQTIRIWERTA